MAGDYAFHIEPQRCIEAHAAIDAAANRIRTLLEEVDRDGQQLLAGWDGEAREALLARQRQWHADAEVIWDRLRRINTGLERAVQIYVSADRRGVDLITGA